MSFVALDTKVLQIGVNEDQNIKSDLSKRIILCQEEEKLKDKLCQTQNLMIRLLKFTSCLMFDGKRSCRKAVYGAFEFIEKKVGAEPIKIFHDALENVQPQLEVRSRRVGGATYQVPVEVRSDRALALAIRWLINSSRNRSENSMTERLSGELIDASSNRGASVKKKEDTHKMAEANKAFSHYRW